MTKSRSYLLAEVIDGEPNAETRIERLRTFDGPVPRPAPVFPARRRRRAVRCTGWSRTRARPTSFGCTWPRWGWESSTMPFYPELLDKAPDDYAKPLQLLARGIRFVDPITGKPVEYRSGLELSEAR